MRMGRVNAVGEICSAPPETKKTQDPAVFPSNYTQKTLGSCVFMKNDMQKNEADFVFMR